MITTHAQYFAGKLRFFRLIYRPKMLLGEKWVHIQSSYCSLVETQVDMKMGLFSLAELCVEKVWKTMVWAGKK